MPQDPRRLALLVIAALTALFAATTTLSAWYHTARAARAREHVAAGRGHEARGELARAADEYRAALLLERDDPAAERALALALLELGRLSEAESYLIDLLQDDPVSGPLNLALARIRASTDPATDARRLYQRAIYGEWADQAAPERVNARFELAEYLSARDAREELLAELLRLRADLTPDDTRAVRRLADLFTSVNAADRAVEALRAAAESQPRDVALLAQLGAAQIQAGQATDARATYRRALALEPDRRDLRERLMVVDRVLAIDPTRPNLRLTTRARRARILLAAVVEQTATCDAPPAAPLRADAETRLARRTAATAAAGEEDLSLALQLWSAADTCRSAGTEAEAISQVIQRVAASAEDPQP